jgi:hypothetical protein
MDATLTMYETSYLHAGVLSCVGLLFVLTSFTAGTFASKIIWGPKKTKLVPLVGVHGEPYVSRFTSPRLLINLYARELVLEIDRDLATDAQAT